jgi:hypothetical protein
MIEAVLPVPKGIRRMARRRSVVRPVLGRVLTVPEQLMALAV